MIAQPRHGYAQRQKISALSARSKAQRSYTQVSHTERENSMGYIINGYNRTGQYWVTKRAKTREEADAIVADLLATGDYAQAGIDVRWNPRTGD